MKTIKLFIYILAVTVISSNCTKDGMESGKSTGAGGSTARFTISGNYLYVVDHTSLKSFLISGPSNPVLKSIVDVGLNIETIFPYNGKLFIGSSSTMYIYSLATPEKPSLEGKAEYQIRMSCDPVVARDSVAYATLRSNGPCGGVQSALVTYSIKDPTKPVLKATDLLVAPFGLGLHEQALYVCEGSQGLNVYDVTNAFQPRYQRVIRGETFYDVIPYGGVLICQVEGGVSFYDIATDPLQPVFLSKITN